MNIDQLQTGNIQVDINEYKKGTDGNVYFYIQLNYNDEKSWKVEKTYFDFEEFHSSLSKILQNIPILPPKSIFKLSDGELDKRRMDLNKYLKVISNRKDVLNSSLYQEFICFTQVLKNQIQGPQKISQISDFIQQIRDFLYIKEYSIMIVALGDMTIISKMGGILSSITNTSKIADSRGRIIVYKEKPIGTLNFFKLWQKDFKEPVSHLYWNDKMTVLSIGYEDGSVECLRIKTEKRFEEYENFCLVKRHSSRITGIAMDPRFATLYTISRDKTLILTNISKADNFAIEEKIFTNELQHIQLDFPNNRMYVADQKQLYLLTLESPLNVLVTVQHHLIDKFASLYIDSKKQFILFGAQNGNILIYEIPKAGREKYMTQPISQIVCQKGLKSFCFSIYTKKIFANYLKSVQFIDSTQGAVIYTLDAHSQEVEKLQLVEEYDILITSGKDKSIKIWGLTGEVFMKINFDIKDRLDAEEQYNRANKIKQSQNIKDDNDDQDDTKPQIFQYQYSLKGEIFGGSQQQTFDPLMKSKPEQMKQEENKNKKSENYLSKIKNFRKDSDEQDEEITGWQESDQLDENQLQQQKQIINQNPKSFQNKQPTNNNGLKDQENNINQKQSNKVQGNNNNMNKQKRKDSDEENDLVGWA